MHRIVSLAAALALPASLFAQSGFSVTGPGCPGFNGNVPSLNAESAFVGNSFDIIVENCDPRSIGTLLMVGGLDPMIDLNVLGVSGCVLRADPQFILRMDGSSTRSTLQLNIPNDPLAIGGEIYSQAWCFVPGLNPLNMSLSNGGKSTILDSPIRFSADGGNSFNSNTSSGFFRVQNATQLDIVSMSWSWVGSSVPGQTTQVFDTDQTSMADRADGGNSTAGGCSGTVRNGSDIATGLVYVGTPTSPCDSSAQRGWVGSDGTGGANFRTVDFSFTNFTQGSTFEMDMDTDNGIGTSGGDMQGLIITVMLSDGSMRSGELVRISGSLSQIDL